MIKITFGREGRFWPNALGADSKAKNVRHPIRIESEASNRAGMIGSNERMDGRQCRRMNSWDNILVPGASHRTHQSVQWRIWSSDLRISTERSDGHRLLAEFNLQKGHRRDVCNLPTSKNSKEMRVGEIAEMRSLAYETKPRIVRQ